MAGRLARLLAAAAVLLLAARPAAAQTCGTIDALARGTGKGANDAAKLAAMDKDPNVGLIYLPAATYRITTSLTLNKPIFGESGALLSVEKGVTLTINAQPEHPRKQLFKTSGNGKVLFGADAIRAFPEWWGAVGNGVADDAAAVQAAFNAAANTGNAMLYLTNNYGVGRELVFTNRATVAAEPSARFTSVKGNARGLTFTAGGFAFKNILPHFSGFSDFCLRLHGSDLASMQLQTLANCGDAIRLEATAEATAGKDYNSVLDNTLWFDTITNSRNGVAVRASLGCAGASCVFQGNQVLGNAINGCSTGQNSAVGFYYAGGKPAPAWDANQFNLGSVTPCKSNAQYSVLYVSPNTESAREVLKIGSLGSVGSGKVFDGYHVVLQGSINLKEAQPEGAARLRGLAALVEWSGQTTPAPGAAPVQASTQPRSKASFNGGRSLLGNYFTIQAVPDADWPAGEMRKFWVYHQMATGELYQIKCDAPRQAANGLPTITCTEVADNSKSAADEVQLTLINLTGRTIPKGAVNVFFNLAVATLGSP